MRKWLDDRLRVQELLDAMFKHPAPKRSNYLDYLGFATLFAFLNEAITGILLATVYIPSANEAYSSVKAIEASVAENFVRSLHAWGANFMIVLVVLHLLRVFFVGAYKYPRELTWVSGVILLLGTVALGFTGYLLPWDQEGYWATTVGTSMAGYVPVIGDHLVQLLRDGVNVTSATLTRFYAIHILVLPGVILLGFLPHIFFVLRQGMSSTDELTHAKKRGEDITQKSRPFYPNEAFRMALSVLVIAVSLFVLAAYFPKELGDPSDPLNMDNYTPKPAWYFMGVYQLLKYVPGSLDVLAMVGLPLIGILVLLFLPWIDRNPSRLPKRRPIALGVAAVVMLGLGVLTYQGMNSGPKALATTVVVEHPSFDKDILPIFQNYCNQCHPKYGSYSGISKEVTPENPDKSLLYESMTGKAKFPMPPGKPLSKENIETFENWIQDGAKNN
ncbi:cytochrome bc complex cytochrome b subunit [Bacillus sp. DNRA2]|uniref:cytochrome b n=1 Tax=Bacillus sp. DNRA2 TaxID=2723053 RepID=UPI00145E1A0F|nr:cytochrome bc complex cytochrome b subunit [Bacillus sp. DNRA2]NMD72407.1 cytochrome bc complex cytochrome b subunit [Bacillus sp. DNRA2]